MGAVDTAIVIGERLPWPDAVTRAAIEWLVARTGRQLASAAPDADRIFAQTMRDLPIALNVADANAQHYEVPADFFTLVLGPRRKYSCCLFDDDVKTLAAAEERALAVTVQHAALADGQRILELGCGWGSLSLWMASHLPNARIVAVSNSNSQREFIARQARAKALVNLQVVTADMNDFATSQCFDRVVSVEMFEHMTNWRALLARIRDWLTPEGRLFLHVFAHSSCAYRFDHHDPADWIARHFFTGGIMPSHGLIREFCESFAVEQEWRWSGEHYRRTAEAWLANFDGERDAVGSVLRRAYGPQAPLWGRRWRLFFLATIGLFSHAGGTAWGVSHYRLAPS